jgi:hypothetical protein
MNKNHKIQKSMSTKHEHKAQSNDKKTGLLISSCKHSAMHDIIPFSRYLTRFLSGCHKKEFITKLLLVCWLKQVSRLSSKYRKIDRHQSFHKSQQNISRSLRKAVSRLVINEGRKSWRNNSAVLEEFHMQILTNHISQPLISSPYFTYSSSE